MDETEKKYKEMEKAERKAKKLFKAMNCREQELDCCATCEHSVAGCPEEDRQCNIVSIEISSWLFGRVNDLDICDKYERRRTG